jgi:nucleoside-diphosphate-sugar epimerase
MAPKVAFITGGNGITGSAIIEYLAKTSKDEWSDIIVTSRSPFKTLVEDPRIKFIALDFTKTPEELIESMREVCGKVTHAYFSSYVHKDDFAELNSANQALFENFLRALVKVTPKLEAVCLQTGGKYYNVSRRPCDFDDVGEERNANRCQRYTFNLCLPRHTRAIPGLFPSSRTSTTLKKTSLP